MQIGMLTQIIATDRHDTNAPNEKTKKYPIEANVPAVPNITPRIGVSLFGKKNELKHIKLLIGSISYQISLVYVIELASFSPKPSPIMPNAA